MSNRRLQTPFRRAVLLALPFVLAYFVIRSLPVTPCDFLHEESYNLEGELDYCGPGDAGFVDLSVRKWPMNMVFKPIDTPTLGKPCRFEIHIKQFDGSPLGPDDIALSHTKKIHLMAINSSLGDYQHLHPEADQMFDGTWRFTMTPQKEGIYKVFLDFIPLRSPRRVLLSASFQVAGESPEILSPSEQLTTKIGSKTFSLKPPENSRAGEEINLELQALDKSGNLVRLTPVMGAFAHLVAFDRKLNGFAHLHPTEDTLPKTSKDIFSGPLTFSFIPPEGGVYRLWAQLRIEDEEREIFIPFDIVVDS
jgi:hypothetical protein